jgi:hypothetical protein
MTWVMTWGLVGGLLGSKERHGGLARNELLRRYALPIGFVALASLGIGTLFVRQIAPPGCRSEQALDRLSAILRDEFHLDGIFVNDVETVSGWYLSDRHECSAEVAQIRGNINAVGLPWRAIRYRIVQAGEPRGPVVTVEMGEAVPLSERMPSFWKRFFAYLGIRAG